MKKSIREMLETTKRDIYPKHEDILTNAPITTPEDATIELFHTGTYLTDNELEKEYSKRGLVPADILATAKVADKKKFVGTHWKGTDGMWYVAAFSTYPDERMVKITKWNHGWVDGWWYAGIKSKIIN